MQIIEDRHSKAATIITAQMPVTKSHEYIADPALANTILDRVLSQAHRIKLKGNSMRKNTNNNSNT